MASHTWRFFIASRNFNRRQALEKEVKDLYCKLTIGGTGAVTLTEGYGFASCTRVSQGLYRLTLQDAYRKLKSFRAVVVSSSAEDLTFQVKLETVATTKLVEFFTLASGSVADPASGDVILVKLEVKNTDQV